jgi:hypothetical protein
MAAYWDFNMGEINMERGLPISQLKIFSRIKLVDGAERMT